MCIRDSARTNPAAGADPNAVFQCDRLRDQIKRGPFEIVAAGAKKRALRNADVAADDDALQIQQPAFLAQPDVVANGELPRKSDFYLRLDGDVAADARPERAQHRTFQRGKTERTQPE